MKRFIVLGLVAVTFISSCSKSDSTNRCAALTLKADSAEFVTLQNFISTHSIVAQSDPRGFFYSIDRIGTDTTKPSICSTITISYTGRLTNGIQFDAANGVKFPLANLIAGWQEGIPLLSKGGAMTLYLPPSLGYGSTAKNNIPANSILIFQIDLISIQ